MPAGPPSRLAAPKSGSGSSCCCCRPCWSDRARSITLGAFLGTPIVFDLGYATGEIGGRLVYAHGAAQVYVANGGVSDRTNTEDAPQGEDSDSH